MLSPNFECVQNFFASKFMFLVFRPTQNFYVAITASQWKTVIDQGSNDHLEAKFSPIRIQH